jgi:hypothetical protein
VNSSLSFEYVDAMMTSVGRRFLGLCLSPLVFYALDNGLTLFGQSAEYWAGNYRCANEASPTFNHLLQIHPAAFLAGTLLWAAMFVAVILLLPAFLALITSIVVTFGHTLGAATWLMYRFHFGYQMCLGLLLVSSIVLASGIYWGWQAQPAQKDPLSNWPPVLRWSLIVSLVGIAVYLFLWPRTP